LVDHRTGLLIELFNHRQRPLQAVQIRLPAKGLVQIRDSRGQRPCWRRPPTLSGNPQYRSGRADMGISTPDYAVIRQGGTFSIRHADGSADIQVYPRSARLRGAGGTLQRRADGAAGRVAVEVLWLGYRSLVQRGRVSA
jgi:hypothetical protein